MINRLIDVSLKNRVLVIALYLGLGGWGWWALRARRSTRFPTSPTTRSSSSPTGPATARRKSKTRSPIPLTVNLQGLAGVRVVRSQSAFGFSMIYVVFEDDVDLYFARTRVLERLSLVATQLPEGVVPTLGPDATGVGHVFWYTVESRPHSLRDLRTLQDWFIRYQLNAVPGVAEVASVGGHVQQYQIDVDPNRLRAYNLSLGAVVAAVRNSNENVGGNVLEANGTWSIVRGVGLDRIDRRPRSTSSSARRAACRSTSSRSPMCTSATRFASPRSSRARTRPSAASSWRERRERQAGHRRREGAHRADRARPSGGRAHRAVLRPLDADRAGRRNAAHARSIEEIALVTLAHVIFLMHFRSILIVTLPLPLAVLIVVPRHVLRRHLVEHHEPRGHRHRDRRAGRCRHRRHRERLPLRRAARHRSARSRRGVATRCSSRRGWSDGRSSFRWRSSCSRSSRCSR